MSVYVDGLVASVPTARWPFRYACHLWADTLAELHEMAGLIGLSRSWFQEGKGDGGASRARAVRNRWPHYDLTAGNRQQAVARGAVESSRRHAVKFRRNQDHTNKSREGKLLVQRRKRENARRRN